MRFVKIVGIICSLTIGLGGAQALATGGDGTPDRAECTRLALEKKRLDRAGMRTFLERAPESVAAERGRPFLERVRAYIQLSETVLFKCPQYVLNANKAPLAERIGVVPPLPVKGPVRVRRPAPRKPLVPLPVKRQSRGWQAPVSRGALHG